VHDPVADTPPGQPPFDDLVQLQTAAVVAAARVGWARINAYPVRWIRNRYERLRPTKKTTACWQRITSQHPGSSPIYLKLLRSWKVL
jgi:hypothetical protein